MKRTLALALALALSVGPAVAGAQTYSFATSVGTQPPNVGTITLMQVNATTVNVSVDLLSGYGFLNTGGPHTPFAFTLAGTETGVSATFLQPVGGTFAFGMLSLSTANGDNTPFGTYGVSILSSAGNGTSEAYFGDLVFNVTRASGLTTNDFITNADGFYFSADLTNGQNTGAQAWATRSTSTVPEPTSLALVGTAVLGLGVLRFRRRAS
jgi:hypothetical protein